MVCATAKPRGEGSVSRFQSGSKPSASGRGLAEGSGGASFLAPFLAEDEALLQSVLPSRNRGLICVGSVAEDLDGVNRKS
jgi:hypothetical protein